MGSYLLVVALSLEIRNLVSVCNRRLQSRLVAPVVNSKKASSCTHAGGEAAVVRHSWVVLQLNDSVAPRSGLVRRMVCLALGFHYLIREFCEYDVVRHCYRRFLRSVYVGKIHMLCRFEARVSHF